MEDFNWLRLIYETHIEASIAYDGRRFALLQSYLAGITVVFAFWFNTTDPQKQKVLLPPLVFFALVATFFAAYLIYVYSRDSHTYFLFAEEVMYRLHEAETGRRALPVDRTFFADKWVEAAEKFSDRKLPGVLALWVAPVCLYAIALIVAAISVRRSASTKARQST